MPSDKVVIPSHTTVGAALHCAEIGWPVVPGAVRARPTVPSVLLSGEARVLAPDTPVPLPPSASGETAVVWLVTPEGAGDTVMAGDEPADIIQILEGE